MRISDWSSDVCSSDLLAGARLEIAPERFEHRLPRRAPARHVVEFVFEVGGEVVRHIFLEEALEERRQQPARFLGEEAVRSEEHTSELQSLMRTSYAVFSLKQHNPHPPHTHHHPPHPPT